MNVRRKGHTHIKKPAEKNYIYAEDFLVILCFFFHVHLVIQARNDF